MNETPSVVDILEDERSNLAPSVPTALVEAIYRIEERVQFDAKREDAVLRIQEAVQAQLAKETLGGDANGDEA